MSKYKFESEDDAVAAQEEIVQKGWIGATEQEGQCIRVKTHGLSSDLILDIEKVIKKHGGKGKVIAGLI
jgi:hypothetical protein